LKICWKIKTEYLISKLKANPKERELEKTSELRRESMEDLVEPEF